MKHQNPYWLSFLALIAICVVSYTFYTGFKLYHYERLDIQVPVQQITWKVEQQGADQFVPHADYQLDFKGQVYVGQSYWNEAYLNEWTAQEMIRHLESWPARVWIDSDQPSYSALQKNFPSKQCISTVILWILMIYFINLGNKSEVHDYSRKNSH